MPDKVDYSFISAREGGSKTTAYVPASGVSYSGVTVATGFDLGSRNIGDLNNLGLNGALVAKLKPYLGKVKKGADDFLKANPLTITTDEAEEIDKAVKKKSLNALRTKYFAAPDNTAKKDFFDLPAHAQTAIASVSFQYGDLAIKAPKFWKAVTAQDWKSAVDNLRDFKDAYKTRRGLEADLVQQLVPKISATAPVSIGSAK